MEVLKSERTLERIETPSLLSFNEERTYIWVIHANKIPPHLGISIGNLFYSLKANGKDEKLPVSKILQILSRKNIATAFYEIDSKGIINAPEKVFQQYTQTIAGEITCLQPLKHIFNEYEATWLKELLQTLEAKELIIQAWGWQLPADFQKIPDYNPSDIHQRLKELQDVQS